METEWGPERLYEERMERQANLFTASQITRDLEKDLQVSKINLQKKAEKEQLKALEEVRMVEKRTEVNAILKAKQESGDSQADDLFGFTQQKPDSQTQRVDELPDYLNQPIEEVSNDSE